MGGWVGRCGGCWLGGEERIEVGSVSLLVVPPLGSRGLVSPGSSTCCPYWWLRCAVGFETSLRRLTLVALIHLKVKSLCPRQQPLLIEPTIQTQTHWEWHYLPVLCQFPGWVWPDTHCVVVGSLPFNETTNDIIILTLWIGFSVIMLDCLACLLV